MAGSTPTVVVAVALLLRAFGSETLDVIRAVLLSVPTVPLLIFTTSVKLAVEEEVIPVVLVHVTTPVPPTPGVVAVQPDGVVTDTNVVFGGNVSLTVTTTPVPPTPGVVAVQPDGVVTDTNVVFGGNVSLTVTEVAVLGPAFDAPIAYERLLPEQIGSGES